ncbi:hypothetical protein M427DRAFT_157881 [Gonapodya prolifera JEL478]|uniref:F-box domain-containing protein n=1 Tax=Gonapodya prolifera (strain JEL478) TaxID=1344416 RepID=A0A139A4Q2_GONPJ|nr:hypothetical protein M427DRAFT_157881 [Gonapodya prolifera JEL478]|eukprot:KXS11787.1 hypothetical protein M427DRAFT_157881 [Gonapodya prolifera JEL478]
MDSLPTETLIPILRFLPPKTFYTQIPLVCRRFRDAAAVAVPGLNAAEVGVACDLRVCEYLVEQNVLRMRWTYGPYVDWA